MTAASPKPERYAEHEYAQRAGRVMPHGNTRSTVFVPPAPPYAVRGDGCWLEDQTGHRVIDCNNNYTSLIHGHAQPDVLASVVSQAPLGTSFGLPTAGEIELAEHLAERTRIPRWRFSNSGTEAVMAAIRAARAYTGRELVVRFDGSFHGAYDGVADANAQGVPASVAAASVSLPQQDGGAFDRLMDDRGAEVAVVVLDLMPNRAGLVPAEGDFVRHVQESAHRFGALLLVDEVITFRLAEAGLHSTYAIAPDLVTLGKVIGGGFPVGAVGGSRDVMSVFDPSRSETVSWGGTFSANPISMVAGLQALRLYRGPEIDRLNSMGDRLRRRLQGAGVAVSGSGSLIRLREDLELPSLWWQLYGEGVLLGTNGLLALSTAMTQGVVDHVGSVIIDEVQRSRGETA